MRGYTKDDVQLHYERGKGSPAVNVKVYGPYLAGKVQDRFGCSEEVAEKALGFAFDSACRRFWEEDAQDLADHYFAKYGKVKVYSEGRSSGWLVTYDLPDVEEWDGVLLNRWALFAKAIRQAVDWLNSWEYVEEEIAANRWAEDGAHEYNFAEKSDGSTVCLVDVCPCCLRA